MISFSPTALVALIATTFILFGVVMFFGLRVRTSQMAANIGLTAQTLRLPPMQTALDPATLLYAVRHDFSATHAGLLVRDSRDEGVGQIIFNLGQRRAAIAIESEHGTFEVDILPTIRQRALLHPSGSDADIRCTFIRGRWGKHRFEIAGVGTLNCKPEARFRLAPVVRFMLEGSPAGVSQHIGGAVDRGLMLILPVTIPLPVRLFVLAMQS